MLYNIYKCDSCKRSLIDEERTTHECLDLIETRFDGNTKWVFDGKLWYPLRLRKRSNPSDENLRLEQSDEDLTEPMKDGFKYYTSFLLIR